MRLMHAVNAAAWITNAVVWYGYAHSPAMAIMSLCATAGSLWMWRLES